MFDIRLTGRNNAGQSGFLRWRKRRLIEDEGDDEHQEDPSFGVRLNCWTNSSPIESKSKGCAGTVVRYGPEPSAVTFNNGTTD